MIDERSISEINEFLRRGNVIGAIRLVRACTGWDLAQAKRFVDQHEEQLGNSGQPRLIVDDTGTRTLDADALAAIRLLATTETHSVLELLRNLELKLFGWNYQVTLDIKGARLAPGDGRPPAVELIKTFYPDSEPAWEKMTETPAAGMVQDIENCLLYEGDRGSGPQFTPDGRIEVREGLLPAFWRAAEQLADFPSAKIYAYADAAGLPGYYVFWFYAYLVCDLRAGVALMMVGSASD